MNNIILCAGTPFSGLRKVADVVSDAGIGKHLSLDSFTEMNVQLRNYDTSQRDRVNRLILDSSGVLVDENTSDVLDYWFDSIKCKFLLIYVDPCVELSNYVLKTRERLRRDDLESVLNTWSLQTRSMISFFTAHRDQCVFVNGVSSLLAPRLLIRELNSRFGLQLKREDGPAEEDKLTSPDQSLRIACREYLVDRIDFRDTFSDAKSLGTALIPADLEFSYTPIRKRTLGVPDLQTHRNIIASVRENRAALEAELRSAKDDLDLSQSFVDQLECELNRVHSILRTYRKTRREIESSFGSSLDIVDKLRN